MFLKKIQLLNPESPLSKKCLNLENQMMTENIPTRLYDNIYGRAFDSAFVTELVHTPPQEVMNAMSSMGQRLADYLEKNVSQKDQESFSKEIKYLLTDKDPRFWFPGVPELENLKNPEVDALKGVIEYLKKPKETGLECISIPFLSVKLSLMLREKGLSPPWLQEANKNYNLLIPMIDDIRTTRSSPDKLKSSGAGITLRHQPSISNEQWMVPSQRPTTIHKPTLNKINSKGRSYEGLSNALTRGIPFASGISGSTNIGLYAWNHFNKDTPIDSKAAFLGMMMFLVYDGGHSMHESLWSASQINNKLNLGFDLGSIGPLEGFVSDYQKFNDMYTGDLKEQISTTFSKSFDKVFDYYNEHSYYALNPIKNTEEGEV
jgi:hypothetical protein